MQVRAKDNVFLGEHGYRRKGEEFAYTGPENSNLEEIEPSPYAEYGPDELRSELTRRKIAFALSAPHKELEALLVADDNKPGGTVVKAKEKKKPEQDGSGSEKYGASDWTEAGRDADGFPVEKGSAEDVSAQ